MGERCNPPNTMEEHQKRVLSVGTFDITHAGHVLFLQSAARLGSLTVGINSDEYTYQYKKKKPVFSLSERMYLVKMLDFVDEVVVNAQDDLAPLIEQVRPDFLVIGSDWGDKYFEQIKMSRVQLYEMGVQMIYIPYTPFISSTEIKKRCTK